MRFRSFIHILLFSGQFKASLVPFSERQRVVFQVIFIRNLECQLQFKTVVGSFPVTINQGINWFGLVQISRFCRKDSDEKMIRILLILRMGLVFCNGYK